MAVDDSSLLPKPPPPRPARRDAAIEVALRRFDGVEQRADEQPRGSPSRPGGWLRRPQLQLLVTASLVAAIGLPAALIAIRDGQFGPTRKAEPPEAVTKPPQSQQAPIAGDTQAEVEASPAPPEQEAPAEPPSAAMEDENLDSAAATNPAPPVVPAAPAPAPPPPPAPPVAAAEPLPSVPMAQKTEPGDQQIMVTGTRIARPDLSSADTLKVGEAGRAAERRAVRAPDWVLSNRAYRTFLSQLQSAVGGDDRQAVARLVAYPLRVNAGGRSRTYRDAAALLADYERVFTPLVTRAILNQRFEQLFGRDQGVMIGNGAVWFDHTCRNRQCSPPRPVRITAINP